MILHPLILAAVAADWTAVLLLLAAGVGALRVLLGWSPEEASASQLALERRAEVVSLLGRGGLTLFVAAAVLMVVGVASALPPLVPGAMCGTGVIEAMGPRGPRSIWLRGLAIAALGAWHLLDRLDRSSPRGPLALAAARALLLASPLVVLAAVEAGRALLGLDGERSVDCCTLVYVAAAGTSGQTDAAAELSWSAAMGGLTALVAVLAALVNRGARRGRSSSAAAVALAAAAALWAAVSGRALVEELAAAHFQVLAHHCPWCLFAARHRLVGYPLFGALALVTLEGGAAAVAAVTARRVPEVAGEAHRRVVVAATRVIAAAALFLVTAAAPAVLWRLRHGVWIWG